MTDSERIAHLERQRDDLHAANNAYLKRARDAETALKIIASVDCPQKARAALASDMMAKSAP